MNYQTPLRCLAIAGCATIALACPVAAETVPISISADAPTEPPAAFANGEVEIAVVRQLNTGDVYQQWIGGMQAEAERLGINLTVYNADGDNARQALHLQQAIASDPDAIILGWGFADSLRDGVDQAVAAGIPIVSYYVDVPASDMVALVDLSDFQSMEALLDEVEADLGDGLSDARMIYVYVPGYKPLDNRNEVFQAFLAEHSGIEVVGTVGVVNANTATETANQTRALLTANPDVTAIIAPYDEFTKGATLAVQELGLSDQIRVYGMDISDADIAVMTEENSPWVTTVAHDPGQVAAVVLRVAAAKISGDLEGNYFSVPQVVVTQDQLIEAGIRNMVDLTAALPAISTDAFVMAPWMTAME